MKYLVIEIQKQTDGTISNITTPFDEKRLALSAYHTACAAAAVSDLPVHSVICINEDAMVIERKVYKVPEVEE